MPWSQRVAEGRVVLLVTASAGKNQTTEVEKPPRKYVGHGLNNRTGTTCKNKLQWALPGKCRGKLENRSTHLGSGSTIGI